MTVIEFKPKEPRATAPAPEQRFDTARQEMLATWADLVAAGTHDRQGLVDEMCATLKAMRGIRQATPVADRE